MNSAQVSFGNGLYCTRAVWLGFSTILLARLAMSVVIPGVGHFWYEQLGHINIGVLVDLHDFSNANYCSRVIHELSVARTEAILYAIRQVNRNPNILPNLTLGVVLCDSCTKDTTSLACAVRLTTENLTLSSGATPPYSWSPGGSDHPLRLHVVGVYGAGYSRQAVMVAGYLNLFRLPLLSPFASSDYLSDLARFPYFSRLIPPDRYQIQAMVDVVSYFNWTYISLVYGEGAYGENAARIIRREIRSRGICVAVTSRLSSEPTAHEYQATIQKLWDKQNARAVVLMLEIFHVHAFFKTVKQMEMENTFVWLGSDSFSALTVSTQHGPDPILEAASGSLYVGPPLRQVEGFIPHFADVNPWDYSGHPWLGPFWQQKFNCSLEGGGGERPDCRRNYLSLVNRTGDMLAPWLYSKDVDGIYVYATALHNLIAANCPSASTDRIVPEDCITGPLLFDFMKNVTFAGHSEDKISFDSRGDIMGGYTIYQLLYVNEIKSRNKVGAWSRYKRWVTINQNALEWPEGGQLPPPSLCNDPCGPREHQQVGDVACCWQCHPCRDNEVLNGTACVQCPALSWPDSGLGTECLPIPPKYLALLEGDWIAIGLTILGSVGVLASVLIMAAFIAYNEHQLIKATGRELSIVILIGVVLANLSVLVYLIPPSDRVCIVQPGLFHLSMHIKYSPLFLKTVRIYRIFKLGRLGQSKVRFISSCTQIGLLTMTTIIQVSVLVATELIWRSTARLTMPLAGVPHVELSCHQPIPGFILPLIPNIIFVLACAVLGFLTKNLPENFNESWYIFVSVSTTIFMWCVFLPTYFTAFYASHKIALLALCLIINSTITICCQFVPKIYAVLFLKMDTMEVVESAHSLNSIKL